MVVTQIKGNLYSFIHSVLLSSKQARVVRTTDIQCYSSAFIVARMVASVSVVVSVIDSVRHSTRLLSASVREGHSSTVNYAVTRQISAYLVFLR